MADEQQPGGETPQGDTQTDFDFDKWLGEQPEHVRKGYEAHTTGLRSALDKERSSQKGLVQELRRLSSLADEGSEARKALDETSKRLEQTEREREFYRDAAKPEIGCTNVETAFLVAVAKDLFNRQGVPDWAAIRAAAPELFARKIPTAHAGNGTQAPPAQPGGMNEFIRSATGRR